MIISVVYYFLMIIKNNVFYLYYYLNNIFNIVRELSMVQSEQNKIESFVFRQCFGIIYLLFEGFTSNRIVYI